MSPFDRFCDWSWRHPWWAGVAIGVLKFALLVGTLWGGLWLAGWR